MMIIVMKRLFLCVAMTLVVAASMAQGSWSGGTGTEEDPYLIKTVADLQVLAKEVAGGAAFVNIHFRQDTDIDLSGIRGGEGWTPIGSYGATGFAGIYDGNGHTVSSLYIKSDDDGQGLFGYVTGGTVRNVVLSLCDITGNNFVGGIVGYNNGTIDGCAVKNGTVRVSGTFCNGGGIAGMVYGGTVTNCLVENTSIDGNYSSLGGITGSMFNATVSGCSVTGGSINGGSHAGGIAGANEGGSLSLSNNHYTSTVKGVSGGVMSGGVISGGIIGGVVAPQQQPELPEIDPEEMEEATQNYVEQLKNLTETLKKVSEQSERLTRDSEEMENLNRTLTGICKVYEMQLKGASQQIGTIDQINEQSKRMADQIAELNKIYTRMIEAMTVNMPKAPTTPLNP